jgi:hypothetical protein
MCEVVGVKLKPQWSLQLEMLRNVKCILRNATDSHRASLREAMWPTALWSSHHTQAKDFVFSLLGFGFALVQSFLSMSLFLSLGMGMFTLCVCVCVCWKHVICFIFLQGSQLSLP